MGESKICENVYGERWPLILSKIEAIREDGEEWRPCPDFENVYLISSHGRVMGVGIYNTCKKCELMGLYEKKSRNGKNNYIQTRLYDNGRVKTIEVHTLVAKAFIPNPDNLPCVNHKDEDKTNNYVKNLEWCTNKYNIRYSRCKPVDVYTKSGVFIETLDGIVDASKKYNIPTSNISRCCLRNGFACYGYQFRFKGMPYTPKPQKHQENNNRKHKSKSERL